MEQLSLSKLNLYIRRVIAVNFQEPVWIFCELMSVKEKSGHVYLELIEKDQQDQIIAQSTAVVWKNSVQNIQSKNSFDIFQILAQGNQVLLQVLVDYNARYGLKLIVQNLDSAYTLGKIVQGKIKTIERLKSEELWQKNKATKYSQVVQNIAIISSESSAGHRDFISQLTENYLQYKFKLKLFEASMQGDQCVLQIVNAFKLIQKEKNIRFDAVVIIRGGGSKHDLLEFDDFAISKAISMCPIPVFTGIGHFIDESLADLSAFKALKTPTAVADEIIFINQNFEQKLIDIFAEISNVGALLLNSNKIQIQNLAYQMDSLTQRTLSSRTTYLNELYYQINLNMKSLITLQKIRLLNVGSILALHDPEIIFSKGYSLSIKNGKIIRDISEVETGDQVETRLFSGKFTSNITAKWPKRN